MGISRQSVIDLKRNIQGVDPKVLQDAFLLSKKITRELQLRKLDEVSVKPTSFFSKEQALQIVQDFYQTIDPDMANIVGSIISNNNQNMLDTLGCGPSAFPYYYTNQTSLPNCLKVPASQMKLIVLKELNIMLFACQWKKIHLTSKN